MVTLVAFAMLLAAAVSMPLSASERAPAKLNSALMTPDNLAAAAAGKPVVAGPTPIALAPTPAAPALPAVPSPPPCVMQDAPINFESYSRGAAVRTGDGFVLTTRRLGANALEDASAIFDSQRPTAGDLDLGSPNAKCKLTTGPGPGVGEGGAPGSPGQNCVALGNLLVAHEGDLERLRARCALSSTSDECAPDDNSGGAEFEFTFDAPVELTEIAVLDVEQSIEVTDYSGRVSTHAGQGDNGKIVIRLKGGVTPKGGKLKIRCTGSCGIAYISRKRCLPAIPPPCLEKVVDFGEYATGLPIEGTADWTLETMRLGAEGSTTVNDVSAAFNTSMPTGDDVDLGAPNAACPVSGPGIGVGGGPDTLGANCAPAGQVLIAHKGDVRKLRAACKGCPRGVKCAGCEPNDSDTGATFKFTFTKSIRLGQMTLMDLDDAARSATVELPSHIVYVAGLGDNSVQQIGLGWYDVAAGQSMTVTCAGSCAIVKFSYYPCVSN